ncbi:MAG: GTP 3',8-cyclase MoaA [Candidatus Omnitrophota bacterium]
MENNINIDYLRFSLTDRCNLNCVYCTPLERIRFYSRGEVLSYEEIVRAVSVFVKAGVRKLRLTGGEPLIKKNITGLIKMLRRIEALEEIAMTTNAVYLKGLASSLEEAGLDRVNISINTLKKEKFKSITGFDYFDDVWAGIKESLKVGLNPVKLNVILMKGVNDDEALDFARLTLVHPFIVRFIEYFPANKRSSGLSDALIKTRTLKEQIISYFGAIKRFSGVVGNGPAEYYKLRDSEGAIGFISSASENFCGRCNRIRLDCAGRVCPCLFSGPTHDMKPLLRSEQSDEELAGYIDEIIKIKSSFRKDIPAGHRLEMSSIGG